MRTPPIRTFEEWRDLARRLVDRAARPEDVEWIDGWSSQASLAFDEAPDDEQANLLSTRSAHSDRLVVPPPLLELCRYVACHRDEGRWALLYRMLFRVVSGERHLLELHTDDDVRRAALMEKAVRRDAHKMEAFVRFVEMPAERTGASEEGAARGVHHSLPEPTYVAWHHQEPRSTLPKRALSADGRHLPSLRHSSHARSRRGCRETRGAREGSALRGESGGGVGR